MLTKVLPSPPAFGSLFGLRSLSFVFADFGTFVLFIFADRFDAAMILIFLSLDLPAIPLHPVLIVINTRGLAEVKRVEFRLAVCIANGK